MAWEVQITGYNIKKFEKHEIIPPDAKFMLKESGNVYICGSYYPYEYYVFQIPVYGKVRTKKADKVVK